MENNLDVMSWIGKSKEKDDYISDFPVKAMASVFNYNEKKIKIIPSGWHWLYFLNLPLQENLGSDGHEKRTGFMPPIRLPIRMYAGGEIFFHKPLIIGQKLIKKSSIISIDNKTGATGNLTFLKINHKILNEKEILINEYQNLVYREDKKTQKKKKIIGLKAPDKFDYEKKWNTSSEMLFRYSALTHNTHKIHYDYPYATETEGYPNIVVHGPLMATFLLDLIDNILRDNGKKLIKFTFRLKSPVFVGGTISAQAVHTSKGLDLWIKDQNGYQSLTALAEISH
ncbi:MAG: acyl-CoA dehydrogenase [Pelagibacterales bacterium]|nr:acyl-CoA dehydrogenase [Pelagibacterales bacterium]PPR15839.1 MAG: Mesaconyl-C(4)-CoA hydratase [Alphaproteobacteria bacterium MarineAlpha9_Bin3]|tara:strand:- start:8843 stop:9691 length:849 start_codon:yes stop_codon:yes gene_type:complete